MLGESPMLTAAVGTLTAAAVGVDPTPTPTSTPGVEEAVGNLLTDPTIIGLGAFGLAFLAVLVIMYLGVKTFGPKIRDLWNELFPPQVTQTVTTTPDGALVVENRAPSVEHLAPTTAAEEKIAAHYEQILQSVRSDKDEVINYLRQRGEDEAEFREDVLARVAGLEVRVDKKDEIIEAKNAELLAKQELINKLNQEIQDLQRQAQDDRRRNLDAQLRIQELESSHRILENQVNQLKQEIRSLKETR